MRVITHTLGCRVNHYESQLIRERLSGLPGAGEVHVVNTCAVTSLAARKGRKLVRKLRREHPRALIVAVGCQATDSPGELRAAGADLVIPNRDKARIRELVLAHLRGEAVGGEGWPALAEERIARDTEQIRANLKVQDGCSVACSFCKTWQVRGPLRSKPPDVAREEAECLAAAGHPELVVAGINLAQYGEDLPGRPSLVDLLRELLRVPRVRIRLSSLNPEGVTGELISLFADERRLCPYLHVPLQSGDDRVLARMGRPYTAAEYADRVGRFLEAVPKATFGADVMVGFPGEDEAAFRRTCSLLEELAPLRLHVFPFSPRPGTPAAALPDQVPPAVKRERATALDELARALSLRVRRGFLGEVLWPVLEERAGGMWRGHAENYIILSLPSDGLARGTILPVRVTEVRDDITVGVIEDNQDI
ncbi:MAG: MiaB/RimO family radical SAM methylthiotransferase [Caldiserica bacterium]|nr:MiaB/RimO family radical SAM methylthiotransferase [Caldisericota bacterium]